MEKLRCNLCHSKINEEVYIIKKETTFRVVKCKSCGLVFLNPQPSQIKIKNMYDEDYFKGKGFDKGVNYIVGLNDKSAWDNINKSRLSNIEKFVKKGGILDIGCGVGDLLDVAKKNGWNTKGTELSEYSSNIANKRFKVDVFCGTLKQAKYPNNHFDAITMIEVIEHLSNPSETLDETYRILKKGGFIVIQTGDVGGLYAKIKGKKWPYFLSGHLYYFSKKTLIRMLKKSGFKVIKTYNGDEISFKAKSKCFWTQKSITLKNSIDFLKMMIIQSVRKLGFGGMTIYAKK